VGRAQPRQGRADVAHDKLLALGFEGSERTTRRALPTPGMPSPLVIGVCIGRGSGARYVASVRLGPRPRIGGREAMLWCAWLAWSRFRVVIPTWDRTLPTVVACLDETLRRFGGSPTYALTDNERTVTIDRIAGIGVRHPEIVAAGRHYGLQITACVHSILSPRVAAKRPSGSPRPTSCRPMRTSSAHTTPSPSSGPHAMVLRDG